MIKLAACLLVIFTAATLLPESLAVSFGHLTRSWEYVLWGAETAALIAVVMALAAPLCKSAAESRAVYLVGAFGTFEAAQRPACRLVFPMDAPVTLAQGQYLCDAAGIKTSGLAVLFASAVAFALALNDRSA